VDELGIWVAKLGRWVAKLGRWAAKLERWVAKLVAHLLATAALCLRIQPSPKNKKVGDISKGVANTL
jgi:hypothetical protein